MRFFRALPFVLALAIAAAIPAAAQTTTITAAAITAGASTVATGKVCFTGTDRNGNPINFTAGGGGLYLKGRPICQTITSGAIVGGLAVPNAADTSPANIYYDITIIDMTNGGWTVTDLGATPNISGSTIDLDTFDFYAQTAVTLPAVLSAGSGAPASACSSPDLYIRLDVPSIYICGSGNAWQNISSFGPTGPPPTFMGTYSSGTTYALDNIVVLNGSSYASLISSNTGNNPITATSDWVLIVQGFNWRGPWVSSTLYNIGDVLQENGNTYYVTTTFTSGGSFTTTNLQLIASAGSNGSAATLTVGSVTSLSYGSTPTVTNTGSSSAAVFAFGIPQGAPGATGATGVTQTVSEVVGCVNNTGQLNINQWSDMGINTPSYICGSYTNNQVGFAQFAAGPSSPMYLITYLWQTSTLTTLTEQFKFQSPVSTSGNGGWGVVTACLADGAAPSVSSWGTPATTSTAVPGTAGEMVTTSTVTANLPSGCATGSKVAVGIYRLIASPDTVSGVLNLSDVNTIHN